MVGEPTPLDHGEGVLGQPRAQVGRRDHQSVTEGEFVLRSRFGLTVTVAPAPVVRLALASRFPSRSAPIEQLAEVLATHGAEGRMRQGRAAHFLITLEEPARPWSCHGPAQINRG